MRTHTHTPARPCWSPGPGAAAGPVSERSAGSGCSSPRRAGSVEEAGARGADVNTTERRLMKQRSTVTRAADICGGNKRETGRRAERRRIVSHSTPRFRGSLTASKKMQFQAWRPFIITSQQQANTTFSPGTWPFCSSDK